MDSSLSDAKRESLKHHNSWVTAGKPKQGEIFNAKVEAGKKYKKEIFTKKQESIKKVSSKLQNSLSCTKKNNFWKVWKSNFKTKDFSNGLNINDLQGDKNIADYLAANFTRTCTPNDINKDFEFKSTYFDTKQKYNENKNELSINAETLTKAVDLINCNKAPGFDNLTVEYIKNAHPSLIIILVKLFTIYIHVGMVPDDFGIGHTTPIPKFKGHRKCANSGDFRGITVALSYPKFSKIVYLVFYLAVKLLRPVWLQERSGMH